MLRIAIRALAGGALTSPGGGAAYAATARSLREVPVEPIALPALEPLLPTRTPLIPAVRSSAL